MAFANAQTHWMTPPPVYDAPSTFSTTALKPYLELPHLISLAWLAYPILSLLFIAFRLQLSSVASQEAVASAKSNLLSSCLAAEKAATAAASMPRYMATATNQQISDAVNGTLNGARAALILSLTVMETIINFIVDLYRSTFLCFLELVIRGGLAILISAVEEISTFIENTLSGLRTSIQNDITSINSAIKTAVDGINKINPFSDITAPTFDVPSLSSLQNVTLPTNFQDALVSLNSSLPTFQDIKDKIESVIDTPFELLKKDINDTFANLTFDVNALPVPKQNSVVFCDQLDTSVVDDLGRDLLKMTKIGIAIIVALALLLFLGNCAVEWYQWGCMKRNMQYTREAWTTDPTIAHTTPVGQAPAVQLTDHNLMILHSASTHPLLTRISNQLSALLRLSPSQHTHLRWFFAYVFHPPALACFLIGFFGLLSVQVQLWAVHPLVAKYEARGADAVKDFSGTIAQGVNASMYAQSSAYATDINGRVGAIQNSLNEGVFGWVNTTTTTLNATLNEFYTDIQDAVDTVFKGTILDAPIQEFLRCFIGSKVDALENALTFLHDNLVVDLPTVNQSALVLSPSSIDEATRPIALAAVGGSGDGEDGDGGLIGKLVAKYVASLEKERIMFAIFMGLWGLVVVMALAIIVWHAYLGPWVRERKRKRWQREHQEDIATFAATRSPATGSAALGADEKAGSPKQSFGEPWEVERPLLDLRSFTPLPPASPKHGFFHGLAAKTGAALRPPPPRRSSESFFDDHAEAAPAKTPNKLFAIGRKALGREVLVRDLETAETHAPQAVPAAQTPGWLKRVTTLWRKDDAAAHITPFVPTPPAPLAHGGWAETAAPRADVEDSGDGPFAQQSGQNPFAMPVPLYHGWEHPPLVPQTPPAHAPPAPVASPVYFLQQQPLAPRPAERRVRIQEPPAAPMDVDMTPVASRFMGAYHTRESNTSTNPFATPFDDEARAEAL